MEFNQTSRIGLLMLLTLCFGAPIAAQPVVIDHTQKHVLDRSGQSEKGKASYYGKEFFGRTMADGTPMDPESNIAASRTLPIGTKAKVTNLDNGKSAVVEIRDRGPYIEGRIVDLTPKTAEELGMTERGVVPVEVAPIEVPQRDGSVKLGSAASASDE
jgi:rare lipoprotein A